MKNFAIIAGLIILFGFIIPGIGFLVSDIKLGYIFYVWYSYYLCGFAAGLCAWLWTNIIKAEMNENAKN